MDDDPNRDPLADTQTRIQGMREGWEADDWREWRRSIIETVEEVRRQRKVLAWIVNSHIPGAAKDSAVQALVRRLDEIDRESERKDSRAEKVLSGLGKVGLVALGALLAAVLGKYMK